MKRSRLLTRTLAAACTAVLASCAARYAPYTGADTSTLRMTFTGGAAFSSAASNLLPVTDGKCGAPVVLPQLFPHFGDRAAASSGNATPTPRGDRAAAPSSRGDQVDLQLAPGRYVLSFIGGMGLAHCGAGGAFDLRAGQQYHVDFRFEGNRCAISLEQLDAVSGTWRPQTLATGEVCRK